MTLSTLIEKATLNQRGETARALKKPHSLKRVLRMTERALARADQAIHEAARLIPPPRPIACGADCPYCCHIRLTASPPEVLLVLEHIHTTWDGPAIETLKRKVKNTDTLTRAKDDDARAQMRLPCPLLNDGSCAVHTVRPLSCRAVASVDKATCKAAYGSRMQDGVPMFEPQYQIANAVGFGLYAGLAEQGFGLENLEMNAALAIGLSDADLGRKWLRGIDVFAGTKTQGP